MMGVTRVFFFSLLLAVLSRVSSSCPNGCECTSRAWRCDGAFFRELPKVDNGVEFLSIRNSFISYVNNADIERVGGVSIVDILEQRGAASCVADLRTIKTDIKVHKSAGTM